MKTVLRLILILLLVTVTVVFNIGSIDIRMQEISYLLGKVADNTGASRSLGIVAKYELIKRRIEQGEANYEDYELEAKIQTLMAGERTEGIEEEKKYILPVRMVLNVIRTILGKEIINPKEENKIFHVLEIGYFWERTRRYTEAIKIYNDVLGMNDIEKDIRAYVLVHKAFCHSMMSEYESAKSIYERVINHYPNTDAGILSWKLLDFIQSIEAQRQKVLKHNLSQLEKAKQFYLLMDYRSAIKHYSTFLRSNAEGANVAEARFFKGRSHEELGEIQEALIEYRFLTNKGGKL
ncbi:MAG: tetratricopeptide repeat protein, partial [Chitinispirillaceae bacterium]